MVCDSLRTMSSQPSAPAYRTALQRVLREDGRRQDWLAAKVGVSDSHMSLIVRGQRHCSDDLAERIAKALGRDTAEILPCVCLECTITERRTAAA